MSAINRDKTFPPPCYSVRSQVTISIANDSISSYLNERIQTGVEGPCQLFIVLLTTKSQNIDTCHGFMHRVWILMFHHERKVNSRIYQNGILIQAKNADWNSLWCNEIQTTKISMLFWLLIAFSPAFYFFINDFPAFFSSRI